VSLLGTKGDGWRPVLKVRLVGTTAEQRREVATALSAMADPKLEVSEMEVPALGQNGNGNGNGKHTGESSEPDVLMFLLNEGDDAAFAMLQQSGDTPVRPALIALLPDHSPTLMRRTIRAGADELLFLPLNPRDAARALIKIAESKRRTQRRSGGVVCSVTSMIGGVGVTSTSINLALALRQALDMRVALVDLDLQRGMLAVGLNLQPEHSILALTAHDKPIDSLQVEASLTKHSSGVYLLAAPKHIEDCEAISDASVAAALDLMREMFDFVIVDAGNHVAEQAVAAWERSDHLIYLLDQSIGGARCAWRFIDLFERLHFSSVKPHFVLNRYTTGYPVTPEQLAQTLSREIYAKLPYDHKAMERVELSGRDLWQVAPTSALTKGFEDLARMLAQAPAEAAAARPNGTVSRLFSAIISRTRGAADEAR
jgi:pilus assembly protein CpaE